MAASAGARVSLPPTYLTDVPEWMRKASTWMLEVNQGRLNNAGTLTCASGTATTVVADARVGAHSFIGLMPTTANAAAELGNGTLYIATGKQTITLTHANAATGDRTFRYCILG